MIAVASSRGVTQTVVLRLFTFLAPYLPLTAHFAAGNFVLQTLLGNDIQIKSDGSSIRSYQYGSDLIRFIVALSVRNTKQPIYNIGSPDPISIFELATTIKNTLNSKSRIIVHGTRGPNEFSVYVPNTRLVEHELGMTSEISLSEGILKTAEWAKTVQIAKSST
jgi:dTDP-glucose 4,6-dehydratase